VTLGELLGRLRVARAAEVTWAHAVNSRAALERVLVAGGAQMIEGDVSWLPDAGGVRMAHPPAVSSDLGFEEWIERIAAAGRGAKLDFKHPGAVEPCLARLCALRDSGRLEIPIVCNADVLPGPGAGSSRFDAERWLDTVAERAPFALPSPGFRTGRDPQARYDGAMADAMLALCERVRGPVTVPIRACLLERSLDAVARMLERAELSVTLWNGRDDPRVEPAAALALLDPERTFLDLIDHEGRPLRGAGAPGAGPAQSG
jgi:hypothetical protein